MHLNADFSKRVVVHAASLPWQPSPMAGVERRMLDRIGGEVARATTIVRYAPGSSFAPHTHGGGEEFLVLDGVFQDEDGDFGAGSYVRNPPGSRHTPRSGPGCTILVKLWQFDPRDRTVVRLDTARMGAAAIVGRPGVVATPLFRDARENVRIEVWAPGARIEHEAAGGIEMLVLDGSLTEGGDLLSQHSWARLPVGARLVATAGQSGCRLWVKEGHLRFVTTAAPG